MDYTMSMKKKFVSIVTTLVILAVVSLPLKADALVPPLLPFGGIVIAGIPCVCSVSTWSLFAPLYLSSVPVFGPLAYAPWGTFLFANFIPPVVPATPYLGAYIPGIQACWIYVGIACVPLPVIGMMIFTGTGLPGGI